MSGYVTLVGAGCGDYDLITLRGMEALKACDAVIYDSLIDTRLLNYCREDAEKICVGKRSGQHSASQWEINSLLIEKARPGKNVVRLKGGDPFVFGRGGEEAAALIEYNIPFSVIPGISSAIAAAELAGIPVTHRNVARSFHVITGHNSDGLPQNIEELVRLDGTLVFLMGLSNLDKIAAGLISGGMNKNTPCAVISNGGTHKQKAVRAELCDISEKVKVSDISAPAVIVVGTVAELDFSATYKAPLSGKSIAIISAPNTANKLTARLHALGAYAFRAGGADIRERSEGKIDAAFSSLSKYDCIALTSPNGARIFLKKIREKHIDLRTLHNLKLAVVGSGTADVLEEAGLFAEYIPEEFNTAALGKLLSEKLQNEERLLILRSSQGSEALLKPLDEKQIQIDDIAVYDPEYLGYSGENKEVKADYAVFTSAGIAKAFFENGRVSEKTKCIAIGTNTAKEVNAPICLTARESTVDGIINTILEDIKCEDLGDSE